VAKLRAAVNERTSAETNHASCKMVNHDLKAMLAEILLSLQHPVTSDPTPFVTPAEGFHSQQQRLQHLNEYCEEAIAEIRASLARNQNERRS